MRNTADRMDHGATALDYVTLTIAIWGAGLSTVLTVGSRRRRLTVSAEFGVARLGSIRDHGFFIVRVANTGQRAVTIRNVEWVAEGYEFALRVFRTSKGPELPVKVEPDEELQILFDIGNAANAMAGYEPHDPPREIRVVASGARRPWLISITHDARHARRGRGDTRTQRGRGRPGHMNATDRAIAGTSLRATACQSPRYCSERPVAMRRGDRPRDADSPRSVWSAPAHVNLLARRRMNTLARFRLPPPSSSRAIGEDRVSD